MTSAEGRGKTYLAEKPKAGGEVITNTGPDGLKTLKEMAERCEGFLINPPVDDWDGVFTHTSK